MKVNLYKIVSTQNITKLQYNYIQSLFSGVHYRSAGFIMEGFPSSGDELRFLASKGLFTDAAIIFEVYNGAPI